MKPLAEGLFPRAVCGLGKSPLSVFFQEAALCNNPRTFSFPTTAVRERWAAGRESLHLYSSLGIISRLTQCCVRLLLHIVLKIAVCLFVCFGGVVVYKYGCFPCMHVCASFECLVPKETRRRQQMPWNQITARKTCHVSARH